MSKNISFELLNDNLNEDVLLLLNDQSDNSNRFKILLRETKFTIK